MAIAILVLIRVVHVDRVEVDVDKVEPLRSRVLRRVSDKGRTSTAPATLNAPRRSLHGKVSGLQDSVAGDNSPSPSVMRRSSRGLLIVYFLGDIVIVCGTMVTGSLIDLLVG